MGDHLFLLEKAEKIKISGGNKKSSEEVQGYIRLSSRN